MCRVLRLHRFATTARTRPGTFPAAARPTLSIPYFCFRKAPKPLEATLERPNCRCVWSCILVSTAFPRERRATRAAAAPAVKPAQSSNPWRPCSQNLSSRLCLLAASRLERYFYPASDPSHVLCHTYSHASRLVRRGGWGYGYRAVCCFGRSPP
eukprot:5686013-Pleurochrysis_carterae.AAC.1